MGMQLHPSVVLGTGAVLRQVELIRIGKGSVIGIAATLSCHLNKDGKHHVQQRIEVGDGVLVGAHASLGPGTVLEDGAVVGYASALSFGVRVEAGAKIGAEVFVRPGLTIGAGAQVRSKSLVDCDIPAGEIWSGNPARRVDEKVASPSTEANE